MRTIFADFNAMTETEMIRLTTRGSQEDVLRARVRSGDWAWLTDGELVVGARVEHDPGIGLVGIPAWDTLVHLDGEDARDPARIESELQPLLRRRTPGEETSVENEARIFRLLTQLDRASGPHPVPDGEYFFALRRALALRHLGRSGLAMLEIQAARREKPDDPVANFLYLDLLGSDDFSLAVKEAEAFARSANIQAMTLSACINILATKAENARDDEFGPTAACVLGWCDRFEHAPDLARVPPSLVALTSFNQGLMLLRLGRVTEAQSAFRHAHDLYPGHSALAEAGRLSKFDQRARAIARSVRLITGSFENDPVAA